MVRRRLPAAAGQALVLALVVLTLVSAAVALWSASLQLRLRRQQEAVRRVQLSALLDAAVARSLAELEYDAYFPGLIEEPFGRGTLSSQVEFVNRTKRVITATSELDGWTRSFEVQAQVTRNGARITGWERVDPP